MNIDFIIFWVDGSDIEWQKKKALQNVHLTPEYDEDYSL